MPDKKVKCYNCNTITGVDQPFMRDSDGYDVWKCPSCGAYFKLDIHEYLNNRGKENFVSSTFYAGHSMAHSNPLIEFLKKEKKWLFIMGAIIILAFCDDLINNRY